jgi:hypothetical protein
MYFYFTTAIIINLFFFTLHQDFPTIATHHTGVQLFKSKFSLLPAIYLRQQANKKQRKLFCLYKNFIKKKKNYFIQLHRERV